MYKPITLYFGILAILLISCVARQKAVSKATEIKTLQKDSLSAITNIDFSSFENQQEFSQTNYLKDVLSALNIGYNGKSKEDQLQVEVSKTASGTKVAIAGTGTANYNEEYKEQFQSFEAYVISRQDSLHEVELTAINKMKSDFESKLLLSNKKITKCGFSTGFYIIAGFIILLLILIKTGFKWPFKTT